ncbi:MAG: putative Ig domain-containing protein, partial [Pirellulales bacterium]|nr:putative Ig domain-containing protein [Pirellulales bacterium]
EDQPPVITPVADQNVVQGETLVVNVVATDPDPTKRPLVYSLGNNPPAGASIDVNTGRITFTPPRDGTAGEVQFTVTVTEVGDSPLSSTSSFKVNVAEDQPPVITPIADQTVKQRQTLSLQISATDPDPTPRPLRYSLGEDAPNQATIDPITGQFTFSPDQDFPPGELTIEVIVTEQGANALESSRTFKVTVLENLNASPVIQPIAPQSVAQRKTLSLNIVASDPEGTALHYSLIDAPAGASIDANTGLLHFSPDASFPAGPVVIKLRVTDSDADPASTEATLTVTVLENPNRAPTIDAVADQTVTAGKTLNLSITAADQDDPASTLAFSLLSAGLDGATIDPVTGAFSLTTAANTLPGVYSFTVGVTEQILGGLSASMTFSVKVEQLDFFQFIGFAVDSQGTSVVNLQGPTVPAFPSFVIPTGAPAPTGSFALIGAGLGYLPNGDNLLVRPGTDFGANTGVGRQVAPANQESNSDDQGQTSQDNSGDGVVPASGEEPVDKQTPQTPPDGQRSDAGQEPALPAAAMFDEWQIEWVQAPRWTPASDTIGRWAEGTYTMGEAAGRFDPDLLDLDLQLIRNTGPRDQQPARGAAAETSAEEARIALAAEVAESLRRVTEERARREAAFVADEEEHSALTDATAATMALGFYMPLLVTDLEAPPAKTPRRKARRRPR